MGSPSILHIYSVAAALLCITSVSAHTPYGYQSDSTQSWEYRNNKNTNDGSPVDPSTYAGSIHYDPLHHALYLTGATYGSGIYDGVDVYELTTNEAEQLNDEDPTNDGYWWVDMATGLKPHLQELGVPGWEAVTNGDCFYAVLGLPADTGGQEGSNGQNPLNSNNDDANRVKVVHSRRFGSEESGEACSAMDILFTKQKEGEVGGYMHDFTLHMGDNSSPSPTGIPPDGANGPPSDVITNAEPGGRIGGTPEASTPAPTVPATIPTYSPTTPVPTVSERPSPQGGWTGFPTVAPAPLVYTNPGPESRFRALDVVDEQDEHVMGEQEVSPDQSSRQLQTSNIPNVPIKKTRSVRLLMAGHVEPQSINKQTGYIINDLETAQFNEQQVYAFAQQVDVRLPAGDLSQGQVKDEIDNIINDEYDDLGDYSLHSNVKEEDELAQELGMDWMQNIPQDDFEKIVTSGVESRALLNDHVPPKIQSVYPVSLVADPTSMKHYYVVLLASDSDKLNVNRVNKYLHVDPTVGDGATQRSWTEFHTSSAANERFEDATNGDHFGRNGRPNYGSDYRMIVKKMDIEAKVDRAELTDAEVKLADTSYEGDLIAMRHDWMQEFEPDFGEDLRPSGLLFAPSGNSDGKDDVLIVAGTTAGRGSAFGTMSEGDTNLGAPPPREDLDGFLMKIRTDTGAFAGKNKFDSLSNSFRNTYSMRIKSQDGRNEIVAGVCAKPLRSVGTQEKMTHVYVVGSTSGLVPGLHSDVRDPEFISKHSNTSGVESMEAFLMKVDLATMNPSWSVQVGAFLQYQGLKGDAYGFGCAVTRDGQDVYLTGLVKQNGVVTDFSKQDWNGVPYKAVGGTDIFVASYKTNDGSRNFLTQVGSTRDDHPSRGNGGITTDRFGNAIITGNTRGSLMRKRGNDEFRYGESGKDAASDVFIMSFERGTASHTPVISDGVPVPAPPPPFPPIPSPPASLPSPVSEPAPAVETIPANQDEIEKKNGALLGVLGIAIAFIILAASAYGVVVYRIKSAKIREQQVLMESNLHGGRRRSSNLVSRRSSTWGMRRGSAPTVNNDAFNDLNIMVEVRNSASGGWHGVYDDEQLQAIDFGVPSGNDSGDVVEQSLFMEDGLKEIEDNLGNYEIGEMDADVSDEDLIKAYNDAMQLDIEPENPDVEFAMQGLGSEFLDEDHHQIT